MPRPLIRTLMIRAVMLSYSGYVPKEKGENCREHRFEHRKLHARNRGYGTFEIAASIQEVICDPCR